METAIIVVNEKTGAQYFSSSDTSTIIEKLLLNNPNNALKVGYKMNIDNNNLEIVGIAIPEFTTELINGVNAFIKLYVKVI